MSNTAQQGLISMTNELKKQGIVPNHLYKAQVEDERDPFCAGRIQARVKELFPDEGDNLVLTRDLPWAAPRFGHSQGAFDAEMYKKFRERVEDKPLETEAPSEGGKRKKRKDQKDKREKEPKDCEKCDGSGSLNVPMRGTYVFLIWPTEDPTFVLYEPYSVDGNTMMFKVAGKEPWGPDKEDGKEGEKPDKKDSTPDERSPKGSKEDDEAKKWDTKKSKSRLVPDVHILYRMLNCSMVTLNTKTHRLYVYNAGDLHVRIDGNTAVTLKGWVDLHVAGKVVSDIFGDVTINVRKAEESVYKRIFCDCPKGRHTGTKGFGEANKDGECQDGLGKGCEKGDNVDNGTLLLNMDENTIINTAKILTINTKKDVHINTDGEAHVTTEKDSFHWVKGDSHVTVDGDHYAWIHGDEHCIVDGDQKCLVKGDQDCTVKGDQKSLVKGDQDCIVKGNQKCTVEGNQDSVVKGDQKSLVEGNQDTTVNGDSKLKVQGTTHLVSEKEVYVKTSKDVHVKTSENIHMDTDPNKRINLNCDKAKCAKCADSAEEAKEAKEPKEAKEACRGPRKKGSACDGKEGFGAKFARTVPVYPHGLDDEKEHDPKPNKYNPKDGTNNNCCENKKDPEPDPTCKSEGEGAGETKGDGLCPDKYKPSK